MTPADLELGVEDVKGTPVDRDDVEPARLSAGLGLGSTLVCTILA